MYYLLQKCHVIQKTLVKLTNQFFEKYLVATVLFERSYTPAILMNDDNVVVANINYVMSIIT